MDGKLREELVKLLRGDQVIHNGTDYPDEIFNKFINEQMYGTKANAILDVLIDNLPKVDRSTREDYGAFLVGRISYEEEMHSLLLSAKEKTNE